MHKQDPQLVGLQTSGLSEALPQLATAATACILASLGILMPKPMLL